MKTLTVTLAALVALALVYFVATPPAQPSLKDKADQNRNAIAEAQALFNSH